VPSRNRKEQRFRLFVVALFFWYVPFGFTRMVKNKQNKEERYSRVPRLFVLCHDLIDVLNKNKEERYSRVPRLSDKTL